MCMMCKLFFNFTCNRFQSKCISSFRAEIRTCFSPWAWAGLRHSKFFELGDREPPANVGLKG